MSGESDFVKFVSVKDEDGTTQLWDIYFNEEWGGSRRTLEMAAKFVGVTPPPIALDKIREWGVRLPKS